MKMRTIQELAKLSGVSVRTLRYYDEIGLLSPRVRMTNGRSLYGIKELLSLTEIRLYKEFGFSLKKIRSILHDKPAYKLSKLITQKKILSKEIDRLKSSFKLIESLIDFYKEKPMSEENPAQIEAHFEQMSCKREYAKYFDEAFMEEKIKQFQEKFKTQVGEEYYSEFLEKQKQQTMLIAQNYGRQYGALLTKLKQVLAEKLPTESPEVQNLIQEQWETLQIVYPETRTQSIYFAIRDQVCDFPAEDPEISSLRDFLYTAMTCFGKQHFQELG